MSASTAHFLSINRCEQGQFAVTALLFDVLLQVFWGVFLNHRKESCGTDVGLSACLKGRKI